MKYSFLYRTENVINGKIYIGVHCTNNLMDGYIGNGVYSDASIKTLKSTPFRNAVKKYGYRNFKITILEFFESSKAAYMKEREIVDRIFIKRIDNYNVSTGGRGGSIKAWMSDEQLSDFKNKISDTWTEERKNKYGDFVRNKLWTEDRKREFSDNNPMKQGKYRNMFSKMNSGSGNAMWNRSKYKIITPYGEFDSIKSAKNALGLHLTTLIRRLDSTSEKFSGWQKILKSAA